MDSGLDGKGSIKGHLMVTIQQDCLGNRATMLSIRLRLAGKKVATPTVAVHLNHHMLVRPPGIKPHDSGPLMLMLTKGETLKESFKPCWMGLSFGPPSWLSPKLH